MDRVLVLGRGGAGKSVFAQELGAKIGVEVIELDDVFWDESLKPLTSNQWSKLQQHLASKQRWIMDGDLGPYDVLEPRLRRADTVVVLDLPFWLCGWRALRRGRRNADFWRWTMQWRWKSRPLILKAITDLNPDAALVVLPDRPAIKLWLSKAT